MSGKSQQVVDDYVGMNDLVTVYSLVYRGLKSLGFNEDEAKSYAWFCQAIYKELKDRNDVVDGLKRYAAANKVLPQAMAMNLANSVKNYRTSAGASIVGPFVDRFAAIAKSNGIELNECSLAVTKVALDIAGAGTGAVSSVTGIGIPLLFLSVVSTFNDSYSLGQACFL